MSQGAWAAKRMKETLVKEEEIERGRWWGEESKWTTEVEDDDLAKPQMGLCLWTEVEEIGRWKKELKPKESSLREEEGEIDLGLAMKMKFGLCKEIRWHRCILIGGLEIPR